MQKWKRMTPAVLAMAGCLYSAGAQAAYLYWSSVPVRTPYVNICMSFAHDALGRLGYRDIRVSATEVAGSTNGAYVAITCLSTLPKATAVVMAVGDNGTTVLQARDAVARTMAGMVRID